MAKKWRDLVAPLHADPVRHAEIERMTQAMEDIHQLAAMRERRGLSQRQAAPTLKRAQPSDFRIEHEGDVYLSTLASYLAAIGGRLEIRAVFPDETIDLVFPEGSKDDACGDGGRVQ